MPFGVAFFVWIILTSFGLDMRSCIIVMLFILAGCENQPIEEVLLREPIEVVEEDDVRVEVYDYEHILPFLERKNGKVNVINFWATWCVPCVAELPIFEQLKEEDSEVTVSLISLDFVKQIPSSLIPFIKENELKSDVIVLNDSKSNEWIRKIDEDWSGAIPATIIYNETQSAFFERSFTYPELNKEVQKFKN
ncbi:MAG: thiol-disulfide isomerase/thioredoxin [Vicingaceae bacterium]|jgi:thiol-disulfide isomerase/thioredoxin